VNVRACGKKPMLSIVVACKNSLLPKAFIFIRSQTIATSLLPRVSGDYRLALSGAMVMPFREKMENK
jgi:hypothetical protein